MALVVKLLCARSCHHARQHLYLDEKPKLYLCLAAAHHWLQLGVVGQIGLQHANITYGIALGSGYHSSGVVR